MFESTTSSAAVNGGLNRIKHRQPPPLTTCFRILCHASRIGGVIGKSGSIIKQFEHETSAKIRIDVPNPSSDDRVITVIGNTSVNRTMSFSNNNSYNSKDNNNSSRDIDCGESSEVVVSAAQEALVRVFERILVVAAEVNGGGLECGGVVSCRLLTDKSGIGSVIGKKGKVIEKIRKETGCKVRVLGQDKLPACALPGDEMVEIEGDILALKKALVAVTRCLQDRQYAPNAKKVLGGPHHAVLHETITNEHMDIPSVPSDRNTNPSIDIRASQHEIVFRMLCSNDRVGSIIGKFGTVIQALQKESGASISFKGPVSDCDEQLITISAMETLESRNSPAQNGVMLVFNRLEAGRPSSTGMITSARLLISPNQMGCLLGKRGSIIADMRKVTGAFIKIVGDDQVPKCALENDQVVLMTGEFSSVRDALYSVTGRLRNNLFSSKMSKGHGARGAHVNLPRSMEGLKLSSSIDRPLPPANSQSWIAADVGTGSTFVKSGTELASGGRSAVVTGMSVEIVVPQNVIGRFYGENESNLARLRQISGAKVVVHKPQSGTTDHIVVISGTPDQTKSAQSLLQAFILSD
ncbi:putative K domain-containing protein [Helianthus annuus]|nr:putative K domain-containing protein [Helianthus annuus]KAJ0836114.1 putative K domain-containing protein [Helianthus annuus]